MHHGVLLLSSFPCDPLYKSPYHPDRRVELFASSVVPSPFPFDQAVPRGAHIEQTPHSLLGLYVRFSRSGLVRNGCHTTRSTVPLRTGNGISFFLFFFLVKGKRGGELLSMKGFTTLLYSSPPVLAPKNITTTLDIDFPLFVASFLSTFLSPLPPKRKSIEKVFCCCFSSRRTVCRSNCVASSTQRNEKG